MCVKKGLFFGCSCLVKKAFRLVQISVPALRIAVICVVLTLISPPLQGAAANAFAESFEPLYLKQLESYNREVEQYLQKEEKLKKEEKLRLALRSHVVRRGETLSMIAGLYGVDVESLAYWNELANPNLIFPEQVLDVLTIEGTLYRVKKGDSIEVIARRFNVEPSVIASFNLLDDSSFLTVDKRLVIPGGVVPMEERRRLQATILASRGVREYPVEHMPVFQWPVSGRISSRYGPRNGSFHYGLDIAAPLGTRIRAAAAGVVDFTGTKSGYGLMLTINHGNGWRSLYAHNSTLLAGTGERIIQGQPVGLIGATGNATGPHLHLEIIYHNKKLDPLLYLP